MIWPEWDLVQQKWVQVFGVSGKRFARGSVNQAGLCCWEYHLSFIFFVSKQSANGTLVVLRLVVWSSLDYPL